MLEETIQWEKFDRLKDLVMNTIDNMPFEFLLLFFSTIWDPEQLESIKNNYNGKITDSSCLADEQGVFDHVKHYIKNLKPLRESHESES